MLKKPRPTNNKYSQTGELRKEIKPRGKRKKRELMPPREYQERFIANNIQRAKNKLKYLQKKGYYKASVIAQRALAQMRFLNKKYGFDEDKIFSGKKFRDTVKSGGDINILFRSVRDILDIDTRFERKKYESIKEDFQYIGIDFDKNFNALSHLSSEYHEIFAFLSYNEVSDIVGSGDGDITSKLFNIIENMQNRYITTDKQEQAYKKLREKLGKDEEVSSRQLDNIFNGDGDDYYGR